MVVVYSQLKNALYFISDKKEQFKVEKPCDKKLKRQLVTLLNAIIALGPTICDHIN